MIRRVFHARAHGIPPTAPLTSYVAAGGRCCGVTSADITEALKLATRTMGSSLGFLEGDITAQSLRAAGAMALLCAHVDGDTIRLLGRWQSDEMLCYLHLQAEPVMRRFSQRMLTHGSFTLHPNSAVPMD